MIKYEWDEKEALQVAWELTNLFQYFQAVLRELKICDMYDQIRSHEDESYVYRNFIHLIPEDQLPGHL